MNAATGGTSSVKTMLSTSPPTTTIATKSTGDSGPPEERSHCASRFPRFVRRSAPSIRSSAARTMDRGGQGEVAEAAGDPPVGADRVGLEARHGAEAERLAPRGGHDRDLGDAALA